MRFITLLICIVAQNIMACENLSLLNEALSEYFQLEYDEVALISEKITPYFEELPDSLMGDFLLLAKDVNITPPCKQTLSEIGPDDATINAPWTHLIVFENKNIRILESKIQPNERVPFHTHQWDGIVLTTQGSMFRTYDDDDWVEEEWPPSAEKIDGSFVAHSYQNIGSTEFKALVFEIKK